MADSEVISNAIVINANDFKSFPINPVTILGDSLTYAWGNGRVLVDSTGHWVYNEGALLPEHHAEILAAAHHLREDLGMEFVPALLLRLIGEGK